MELEDFFSLPGYLQWKCAKVLQNSREIILLQWKMAFVLKYVEVVFVVLCDVFFTALYSTAMLCCAALYNDT